MRRQQFKGVMSYLPTSFTDDYEVDQAAFAANVNKLSHSGVQGLFCMGSAGEFFSLTSEEYELLVDVFMAECNPDILRIVGCAAPGLRELIRRAEYAAAKGADAILLIPPYFVPMNANERRRSILEVSKAVPELGIIHYNTGYAPQVQFATDDYEALAALPNLWGSKQGTTDMLFWTELVRRTPHLGHMSLEWLFTPAMQYGSVGVFSAISAMSPTYVLKWYEACAQGDWTAAQQFQQQYNQFLSEVYLPLSRKGYADLAIDKALVGIGGYLKSSAPRPPISSVPEATCRQLRHTIETTFPYLLAEHGSDAATAL